MVIVGGKVVATGIAVPGIMGGLVGALTKGAMLTKILVGLGVTGAGAIVLITGGVADQADCFDNHSADVLNDVNFIGVNSMETIL